MHAVGKAWSELLTEHRWPRQSHPFQKKHPVWVEEGVVRWLENQKARVQFPKSKMSSEKRMTITYRAIRESFLEEVVSVLVIGKLRITESRQSKHVRGSSFKAFLYQVENWDPEEILEASPRLLSLWEKVDWEDILAISWRAVRQCVGGEVEMNLHAWRHNCYPCQ